MQLVKRLGRRVALCALLGLATFGCGDDDDDDDDDGGSATWKCYDNPGYGECGCYAVPPGNIWEDASSGAVEVSTCPTYELCLKYYDVFFEWDGCNCGASGMMPPDAMDIQAVPACPPR